MRSGRLEASAAVPAHAGMAEVLVGENPVGARLVDRGLAFGALPSLHLRRLLQVLYWFVSWLWAAVNADAPARRVIERDAAGPRVPQPRAHAPFGTRRGAHPWPPPNS